MGSVRAAGRRSALGFQAKCSAPLFNNQLGYTANLADSINQVLHRTAKGPPTDGRQPPPPPQAPSTALARILQ
jgi:hypothetical protein